MVFKLRISIEAAGLKVDVSYIMVIIITIPTAAKPAVTIILH